MDLMANCANRHANNTHTTASYLPIQRRASPHLLAVSGPPMHFFNV